MKDEAKTPPPNMWGPREEAPWLRNDMGQKAASKLGRSSRGQDIQARSRVVILKDAIDKDTIGRDGIWKGAAQHLVETLEAVGFKPGRACAISPRKDGSLRVEFVDSTGANNLHQWVQTIGLDINGMLVKNSVIDLVDSAEPPDFTTRRLGITGPFVTANGQEFHSSGDLLDFPSLRMGCCHRTEIDSDFYFSATFDNAKDAQLFEATLGRYMPSVRVEHLPDPLEDGQLFGENPVPPTQPPGDKTRESKKAERERTKRGRTEQRTEQVTHAVWKTELKRLWRKVQIVLIAYIAMVLFAMFTAPLGS